MDSQAHIKQHRHRVRVAEESAAKRRGRSPVVICRSCGATSPRGEACAFCGPGEGE